MKCKNNKMSRMWILYGVFFSIVALCLVLFFNNLITSEDSYHLSRIEKELHERHLSAVVVTGLKTTDSPYHYNIEVDTLADGSIVKARINSFDIALTSTNEGITDNSLLQWAMWLQMLSAIAAVVIFVAVIVLMVSFYKAIKAGRVFQRCYIRWIALIGVLMIVMSLSLDISLMLERDYAHQLLAHTEWDTQHRLTLHFTRLFFGTIVLFFAETLNIGYKMQEEQDLTI